MIVILIISLVILTIRNIFILMIIVVSLIRFDQDDDQDDLSIIIIVIGSPPPELSFDRCYWRGRRKDGPIVIKNLFFIQFRIRQKNNDLTLAARPSFDIP